MRDMDIAYGEGKQRMVVAARGIFRHSDAVPPGTWPPREDSGTAGSGGMTAVDGGMASDRKTKTAAAAVVPLARARPAVGRSG